MSSKFVVLEWALIRDKNTTMQEKLILSEIKQLTQLEKGCVASNQHFADLLGIKRQSASRSIQSLENKGFIFTEIVKGSRNMVRKIRCQQNVATCQQNVSKVSTKCLESKETNNNNKTIVGEIKPKRFKKPNANEVKKYLNEINNDDKIDVDYFIDYYESKDWMVGKNKMKDWKATVRNWIRRDDSQASKPNKSSITNEINLCIGRGANNFNNSGYPWKSKEAEKVFNKIRANGGVPWNGNEWQINKSIQEYL